MNVILTNQRTGRLAANPSDVRARNRSLVLDQLFPSGSMSRADIARETGLTRVTVSEVARDLLDEHLIMESGQRISTTRGKRGILLRIDPEGRDVVVVDLSQPNMMIGVVSNLLGQIVYREQRPLVVAGSVDSGVVVRFCNELLQFADSPILGIGLAVPGTVSQSGTVLSSTSLGWKDVQLADAVRDGTGYAVHVDNDANSAALAEKSFGAVTSDLIFVHVARGLGAGVMVGNEIVGGANSAAGEFGHVVVDAHGAPCRCGKRGCLETVLSVPVLEARIARNPSRRDAILSEAGSVLGSALSMPVGLLDVPYVALYGVTDIVNDVFVSAVNSSLNAYVHNDFRRPVMVRRSRIGDDIVIKGESAAVLRSQLGVW